MVDELGKGFGTTDNFSVEFNCREGGKEVEKVRDHQFPLWPALPKLDVQFNSRHFCSAVPKKVSDS